ncbi:Acylphosphatase [Neochlamydia sp. AcF65]|uniref:acylphosphatase n=1 Tax=Neochlamydia sp. AcF65 TaxID=2795735 RepID=UPI001BC9A0B3|nr:acylphosphatase [Neochlamydia sp. AcF65]MBS4165497.1 Acylphosphatase [Neochlamydia sp. AcF65]
MNKLFPLQEPLELHAVASGRVQGVGFRLATLHYASQLELTGTARNLENGSVEIIAQGPKEKLEKLLALIQARFGSSYITCLEVIYSPPSTSYPHFQILP